MTGEPLRTVLPEDDISSAMRSIAEHDINQVLVVHQGQLVGLLNRADIIRHLQVTQELGIKKGVRINWCAANAVPCPTSGAQVPPLPAGFSGQYP